MYLTDKDKVPARDSSDHEEIELMLEHVSTQVEEVVSEAEGLAVGRPPAAARTYAGNKG